MRSLETLLNQAAVCGLRHLNLFVTQSGEMQVNIADDKAFRIGRGADPAEALGKALDQWIERHRRQQDDEDLI